MSKQFPDIDEIYLTVNNDNIVAQALYKQANYENAGTSTLEGRSVYILRRTIK
ncbi:hypothetical protein [Staphylococcus saprophyticus]|uniref:hypothetical protein n=1 Tax=Staphylococcus saprophyticus TaxID=29385 RepID=UPI0021089095|nr:hypothetical protein [Staphylococcus saprophyticus]